MVNIQQLKIKSKKNRWLSGTISACHVLGPGSIPGRFSLLKFEPTISFFRSLFARATVGAVRVSPPCIFLLYLPIALCYKGGWRHGSPESSRILHAEIIV